MASRGVSTDEPSPAPEAIPVALEQRVRRLEDVVATLQDTRQIEERVTERVADRLGRQALPAPRETTAVVLEGSRRLLPTALDLMRPQENGPRAPSQTTPDLRAPWVLLDFANDLRAILRLILDPHYRMTWLARAALFGILPFILVSSFVVPFTSLPLVGTLLDKILAIPLAFLAYRILSRELTLYRLAVAELPARYRSGF